MKGTTNRKHLLHQINVAIDSIRFASVLSPEITLIKSIATKQATIKQNHLSIHLRKKCRILFVFFETTHENLFIISSLILKVICFIDMIIETSKRIFKNHRIFESYFISE